MIMFKRISRLAAICVILVTNSGCALLGTAISAGAAYGIYQATKK